MTSKDRELLLDAITAQVISDFGEAKDDDPFNPFSPADVARQAVIMLQAAYEEFHDNDTRADKAIEDWRKLNLQSDNLELDAV